MQYEWALRPHLFKIDAWLEHNRAIGLCAFPFSNALHFDPGRAWWPFPNGSPLFSVFFFFLRITFCLLSPSLIGRLVGWSSICMLSKCSDMCIMVCGVCDAGGSSSSTDAMIPLTILLFIRFTISKAFYPHARLSILAGWLCAFGDRRLCAHKALQSGG